MKGRQVIANCEQLWHLCCGVVEKPFLYQSEWFCTRSKLPTAWNTCFHSLIVYHHMFDSFHHFWSGNLIWTTWTMFIKMLVRSLWIQLSNILWLITKIQSLHKLHPTVSNHLFTLKKIFYHCLIFNFPIAVQPQKLFYLNGCHS